MARQGRHVMDSFADDDDFAAGAPPAPTGHRKYRRIAPLWIVLSVVAVIGVVIAVVAIGSSDSTLPAAAPDRAARGSCVPSTGSAPAPAGPSGSPSPSPPPSPSPSPPPSPSPDGAAPGASGSPGPGSGSGRVFACVLFAEESVAFNRGNPAVRATAGGGDVAFRPAADLLYYYQHGAAASVSAADCTSQDQPFDVANLSDLGPEFIACRVEAFGAVSFVEVVDASQVTAADPQVSLRVTFLPSPAGQPGPASAPPPLTSPQP